VIGRAQDCGSQGPEGACCKAKSHRGAHARPSIRWVEWGGICGMSGNYGTHQEPLACAYPEGHLGPHAWESLPTFVAGRAVIRCACPVGNDAIGPHLRSCPNHPEHQPQEAT